MLSQKSTKTLINKSIFLLSFIGLVDASYLTFKHYRGAPPSCSVALGCETVTSSQYAMIGEVPLALLGAFYYVTILVLCCASFVIKGKSFGRMMLALAGMGFLVSAGLVYLQLAVIKAICSHCMLSAATSTGIFGLSILKLLISNSERTEKPQMRKMIQKEALPMLPLTN